MYQTVCRKCSGQGSFIKDPCGACQGVGVTKTRVQDTVEIPAGVDNGETLVSPGKGNQDPKGQFGNLYLKVVVKPHPRY